MLANRLSMWSSKLLLGSISMAACLVGTFSIGAFFESALANSDGPVLLEMPIYSRTSSDDLISRAESMVSQEINQHFDADPSLAAIAVVVLGSRNGDVIPVLTTTVSRTQWQEKPQVSAWTKYYSAYALIRRHDSQSPPQVAASPSRRSSPVASRGIATQFDRQFDAGRLNGRTVQSYVDFVD
ncbi:hypothetical protein Lepto7375DRAFT_8317 [Leptolyngbya sp. PCC 7375]|nr:hypothetical protein Lepto7375DRAFT_8317 [Leptolyngbya sp. PCC 7375]